ncbi:hypothetical protein [Novilysobacter spongiicola]|uniref:Lipoprotein n=1 Tax=Lysobacter spongiicola DSM 21749 TaxID=1122188 RepID=A0A1T4SJM4_9GAMM|nr:hypothetical protein [Lysobacter spongiicola]SKA28490.1 hypothetical protein SAMN02745674_02918 [Lysobacter spongiicola DSM 21749]
MRRLWLTLLKGTLTAGLTTTIAACGDDGHLRGHLTNSPDGKTYLSIADDHNGCPIKVDGQAWTVPVGTPKPIEPGEHKIECYGGEIRFVIPEGVVFNFDYWGP